MIWAALVVVNVSYLILFAIDFLVTLVEITADFVSDETASFLASVTAFLFF